MKKKAFRQVSHAIIRFAEELRELFRSCQRVWTLKTIGCIIAGLFDQDEGFQTMFESSVRAINKERHENKELSNVFLGPEAIEVETDLFEISLKGKAL